MAMFNVPNLDVLKVHRGWEDWLLIGLGGVLLLTPALVPGEMPSTVLYSALSVGVVIMVMALFEIALKGRWEEIIQFVRWRVAGRFSLCVGLRHRRRFAHPAFRNWRAGGPYGGFRVLAGLGEKVISG